MPTAITVPACLEEQTKQSRWMVWRRVAAPNGRFTKPPFRADNPSVHAKSDDPQTWASCAAAIQAYEQGLADGIGYALMDSRLAAIDLDDCRDPESGVLAPWAQRLLDSCGSYAEVTPSKCGIRIIGKASGTKLHRKLPAPDGGSVEVYRGAVERYITISGDTLTPDIDQLGDIDALCDRVVAEFDKKPPPQQPTFGGDSAASDDWGDLYANILAGHELHDSLLKLAAKLVKAGTDPGAVVNTLRGLMERSEAPRDTAEGRKRWKDRYREIPKLVDSAVRLQREKAKQEQNAPIPETDGARVLNDALTYQKRFVRYPSEHAAVAHTLWIAHTHMMDAWESTPRLAFLSAEPTSGKTRSLEISEPMVPNAVSTVNASAAYLFRKAGSDEGQPTVSFDEIDTVFGPKAKEHEDIRGFINAGHRRGATYGRCVVHGTIVTTEDTPVYAAVAVAGLGWLPDTLLARSIIIRMRRRLRTERVEPYRCRDHAPQAKEIGRRLAGWASTVVEAAKDMRPELPAGVEDRAADCWEPLLVVADLAGGEWPRLAREAAVALVAAGKNQTPVSLYLRLLDDTRSVFWKNLTAVAQSQPKGLPTKRLLEDLYALDDAPWSTLNKGEAYTPTQLATCLFEYGAKSDYLRPHPSQPHLKARGYKLRDLADAWRRYLSPLSLPLNSVAAVAGVARETLDQFFEWAEEAEESDPSVTGATPATPYSGTERGRELPKKLDAARVNELAKWCRQQANVLRAEMSPAVLKAHLEQQLRVTLAELVQESALDTEVGRVVNAANKAKANKAKKSARAKSCP